MAVSLINTECKRYGCIKNLLACYANCRYSTRCEELKNEISDKAEQAARDINSYLSQRGSPPITIQLMKRGLKFDSGPAQKLRAPDIKDAGRRLKDVPIKSPPPLTAVEPPLAKVAPRVVKLRKKRKPSGAGSVLKKQSAKVGKAAPAVRVRGSRSAPLLVEKASEGRKKKTIKKKATMKRISKRAASPAETRPDQAVGGPAQTQDAASAELKKAKSTPARKAASKAAPASSPGKNGKVFIIIDGKTANLVDERGLMQHLMSGAPSTTRYFEATEVEARVQIVHKR